MSENEKQGQENELMTDETKVLPLAQIDAQMKDAYKLLQKAQPKAEEAAEVIEDTMSNKQEIKKTAADNQSAVEVEKKAEEALDAEASAADAVLTQGEAATLKDAKPLTLEEKRRQQREQKMTIEERRKLQRENPKALEKKSPFLMYFQQANHIDYGFIGLLVIAELLNLYATIQMTRIFSIAAAILTFVFITLLMIGSLFLTVHKRILGFICSASLAVLLLIGGFSAYRTARFCDKVFHQPETQTVMIVANKDSDITADSDFNNIRIATVKYETMTNELAEALLAEKHKLGGLTQEFTSYQQAYNSLMNGKSDVMVYSPQIEQRLNESNNHSDKHVKVLFEHTQALPTVKAKKVNMKQEPFTILISGVDSENRSDNEKGSSNLNILATINPKTKKLLLQTIPSESRVSLECVENKHTKLAYASAYGGMAASIDTLEELYGITINYYVKVNLNGIEDTVDALGGITVNNESLSCVPYKESDTTTKQACFPLGENHLDGAEALAYSRINQLYSDGEIKQNHLTAVIHAILKKCDHSLSTGTIHAFINVAEDNLSTNISSSQLLTLLKLLKRIKADPAHITSYRIEGEILSHKDEIINEKMNFFYPKNGAVSLVKKRIREIIENK